MDNNEYDVADVIFVPWYVQADMKSLGLNVGLIGTDFNKLKKGEDTELSKVSSDDMEDLYMINNFLTNYFFTLKNDLSLFNSSAKLHSRFLTEDYRRVKELNLINTLLKDGELNNPFILTYENDTVYVILNEGFTNFIKFNNKDFEKNLYNDLINFMFKYFQTTRVYSSMYFKKFLTLNKTK